MSSPKIGPTESSPGQEPGFLPVAQPDLCGNEERYVVEAIRSTWISSSGPFVARFEREFAEAYQAREAISVCNGTAALHLALLALGAGPGDEVLIPALTYVATANAVRYTGATPVLVDVDPATWCLDPTLLEQAITPRTRGIVAVHLYGHPADLDAMRPVVERHGLWVIEDAAEAHLARYRGRPVGGLADAGTFSFYGNKLLTSGEGGAVVVQDPTLAARVRLLRGQGVDPTRTYNHIVQGYNYRLTNVACALLCAQLERAGELFARRTAIYGAYREALAGVPGIGFQPEAPWAEIAPWLFSITVDERAYGRSRDELIGCLRDAQIDSRPFFVPIHHLPIYAELRGQCFPVAEQLGATGLNLPTFSGMNVADVDRVADTVRRGRRA